MAALLKNSCAFPRLFPRSQGTFILSRLFLFFELQHPSAFCMEGQLLASFYKFLIYYIPDKRNILNARIL